MKSALCQIDLGNEQANYTIGQLVTHLKLVVDYSDYEKVEKHLRMREERVKEEARKETEEAVVRRYEGKYEEMVKWKVKVEENVVNLEEDVRVLRENYDVLMKQKGVMDESVRVPGLLALKGNVELDLEQGKLTLGEVKVDAEEVVNEKSDLVEENVRLRKEVRECREIVAELKKGEDVDKLRISEIIRLKKKAEKELEVEKLRTTEIERLKKKAENDLEVEKLRIMEMEKLKKKAEKDIEVMEKHFKGLTEENLKLRRDHEAWRELNKDLREREEQAKVRALELEIQLEGEAGLRVAAEKSLEALESKIQDLVDENLKLRKEIAEWREMTEDLKKQDEDVKVRVWKLENEAEIEESLRRRAEEDLESMEHKFQELEGRISLTEKDTNMSLTGAELDYSRTRKVARITSPMEACGRSRRINLVDLTEGAHPGDSQGRNFTEGICQHYIFYIYASKFQDFQTLRPIN